MNQTKKILRLESMTLRGIGSYYHGAELKFRPLTILCGTNGSGKSTWFNRIAMLQRSLEKRMLPFAFDVDDGDCHNLQNINSLVDNTAHEDLPVNPAENERFGPFGTIGLTLVASQSGSIFISESSEVSAAEWHPASRLLSHGECESGKRFRIRLAHADVAEYHQDLIELVFDGSYVIRRLIRAVLEEEIKQEALNIQFICLKQDDTRCSHSVAQALRINERGQIDNWPEGFMDDDLKESRRLFNIMYGAMPAVDEEIDG